LADSEHRRIEGTICRISGGGQSSPEKIHELEARRIEYARAGRTRPSTRFSAVLRRGSGAGAEPEVSEKEQKYKSLPEKGPRLNPAAPGLREELGRPEGDGDVVLKG
jgi:hypothetical protein